MGRLCTIVGALVGSWVGWWIGDKLWGDITAAFLVGSACSLVGIYLGWSINRDYLG